MSNELFPPNGLSKRNKYVLPIITIVKKKFTYNLVYKHVVFWVISPAEMGTMKALMSPKHNLMVEP